MSVKMHKGNVFTFAKVDNDAIITHSTNEAHSIKGMMKGFNVGWSNVNINDFANYTNVVSSITSTNIGLRIWQYANSISTPILQLRNTNTVGSSADTCLQFVNGKQTKNWTIGIDATDGNFCFNDSTFITATSTFEITAGGDLRITGNLLNDLSITGGKDIDFLDGNSKIRFNGVGNGGNSDFLQVAIDDENRGYLKLFDQSDESNERAYLFYDTSNDRIGFQQHRYDGGNQWPVLYLDNTGDLYISGDYEQTSDKRLKDNVKTIEGSLETIMKLRGVSYTWNDKSNTPGKDSYGLIAQELEEHLPELVKIQETDKNKNDSPDNTPTNTIDDIKTISYPNMAGHFVEAIKEQQGIIEALKKRIEVLESKMENK